LADDLLRQFYVRAARTLSIAHEVFRELRSDGPSGASTPLTRLELELATWKADREALSAFRLAESEFKAADAVWRHAGRIGEKPEKPALPLSLPHPDDIDYLFFVFSSLEDNIERFRETIEDDLPDDSFRGDVDSFAQRLHYFGTALDRMKAKVEKEWKPILEIEGEKQQFITVEQMAMLAGITVPAMNNRLSKSRPHAKPISPGGRKHNAYPWPDIRDWMVKNWPSRTIPKDFQEMLSILRESTDTP
jgi:hypothetical protein